MTTWAERFAPKNLVKGEKAAYCPMLLSWADKALLERAAVKAELSPAVLASRIVSQVLQQNRHRFED